MERRLTFGNVAELYDDARPSYPAALVDDVLRFADPGADERLLEVGAGTGKATVLFAARGRSVLALEPSGPMAAVARRNCEHYPAVRIVESEFESWAPAGETFPLLYCAQAWHWINPQARYRAAGAALRPGGALAVFWNRPRWEKAELRSELRTAYERHAPDFGPDPGPMHPATESPTQLWGDWEHELDSAAAFADPEGRLYDWTCEYTAEQYTSLLQTHSDHILLPIERRMALLGAVQEVINHAGGTIRLNYVTRLCLARKRR